MYLSGDIPSLLGPLTDARLDEIAIAEYLATGAPTENRTFHDGIARVPAASLLCVAEAFSQRIPAFLMTLG